MMLFGKTTEDFEIKIKIDNNEIYRLKNIDSWE